MRIILILAFAIVLIGLGITSAHGDESTPGPANPSTSTAPATFRVVGYWPEWGFYNKTFSPDDLPAAKLTHVIYAFVKVTPDGNVGFSDEYAATQASGTGSLGQMMALKKKNPQLQTLASFGGWNGSADFSTLAATDDSRKKFAANIVRFVVFYGFDGMDLDWETPIVGGATPGKPDDGKNCTLLLAEIRRQFDEQGNTDARHYLLTAATGATGESMKAFEIEKLALILDWFNVMTYDFHGNWSDLTGFNAPLFAVPGEPDAPAQLNVDAAIQGYLARGVPPEKICMGLAFYSHVFNGVGPDNHGLFQKKAAQTSRDEDYNYAKLTPLLGASMTRYWNDQAKVPWAWDEKNRVFVTYDDPQSIAAKAAYAHDQHLGGVMIWDLYGDDAAHSLLNAAAAPGR